MIGNRCNYACTYCPASLHDGSKPWLDEGRILAFARRVIDLARLQGRSTYLQFVGGEVTLVPGFAEMLHELRSMDCKLAIISNGSRQANWWSTVVDALDSVVLTYHPEYGKVEHFRSVVDLLSRKIRTHVNIAAPPDCFDHSCDVARYLEANCVDITITLKPMLIGFGNTLYPYTEEQLQLLRERQWKVAQTRSLTSVRGEMLVTYSDRRSEVWSANQFLASDLNHWPGWRCNIGLELLSINDSGQVYRGICGQGGIIGRVDRPEDFDLPHSPVVCKRQTCSCLTDVMVSRTRETVGDAIARAANPAVLWTNASVVRPGVSTPGTANSSPPGQR
jgi:organic radical activating enzyme